MRWLALLCLLTVLAGCQPDEIAWAGVEILDKEMETYEDCVEIPIGNTGVVVPSCSDEVAYTLIVIGPAFWGRAANVPVSASAETYKEARIGAIVWGRFERYGNRWKLAGLNFDPNFQPSRGGN